MRCEIKGKACDDWKQQEIKSLLEQLVHDPENHHVMTRLGRLHFAAEDQAMAFHYLWQAQDISAEQSLNNKPCRDSMMALGELLMRRGQYVDARWKYMEILSYDRMDEQAIAGKRAAEAGLDAARDMRLVEENPDAEGVLRIINPENYSPRFASHTKPDRATGLAMVQFNFD